MLHALGPAVVTAGIIYFLVTVVIAMLVRGRANEGFLSFLVAGKRMPWWVISFSAFATFEGATTFLGWPGIAWGKGLVVIWQTVGTDIGLMAFTMFLIPIMAKMKRLTLPESFGDRYGSGMRTVIAVLSYSRLLGGGAIMLLGIADVLNIFVGTSIAEGLVVGLVMVALYTMISGQYGVMYSDVFQSLFTILAAFGAPIIILLAIGHGSFGHGLSTVFQKLPKSHFDLFAGGTVGWSLVLGYIGVWFFAEILRPEMYGRIFSAKSSRDGTIGWIIFCSFIPLQQFALMFGGIASRVVLTHVSSPDLAMPTTLGIVAPWFAVLYAVAILSACTAVASASFLGAATVYVTDIHTRYINPHITPRRAVLYTRISILLFAAVSAYWAIADDAIITIISGALTILAGGALVPFLAMFFWSRMNTAAAYASTLLGGGTALYMTFFMSKKATAFGLAPVIFSILVSLVAAVLVAFVTKPDHERATRFADTYGLKALKQRIERLRSVDSGSALAPND